VKEVRCREETPLWDDEKKNKGVAEPFGERLSGSGCTIILRTKGESETRGPSLQIAAWKGKDRMDAIVIEEDGVHVTPRRRLVLQFARHLEREGKRRDRAQSDAVLG